MIKKVFIKPLNELIEIKDTITSISFESPKIFREFVFNIEDLIIYSIDNEEMNINKNVLFIYNPFDLELNSKKNLTMLYKKLEKELNDDIKNKFDNLITESINLMDDIIFDSENKLVYNDDICIVDLFNLFKISYSSIDSIDYLDKLVQYIKVLRELNDYSLIISYNLLVYLDRDEIEKIKGELKLLEIEMLDLSIDNKETIKVNQQIVDNDLNVF